MNTHHYIITATYSDNGTICASNTAETLGDAFQRKYATKEGAEKEAEYLRDSVKEVGLHPSTAYEVEEREGREFDICDEATRESVEADNIANALEKYFDGYDTADMADGESFSVQVYDEDNTPLYTSSALADGKGGVDSYNVPA